MSISHISFAVLTFNSFYQHKQTTTTFTFNRYVSIYSNLHASKLGAPIRPARRSHGRIKLLYKFINVNGQNGLVLSVQQLSLTHTHTHKYVNMCTMCMAMAKPR